VFKLPYWPWQGGGGTGIFDIMSQSALKMAGRSKNDFFRFFPALLDLLPDGKRSHNCPPFGNNNPEKREADASSTVTGNDSKKFLMMRRCNPWVK
jgi:hypothetical protein